MKLVEIKRDPTENKRNHIGMHNQKDIAESRNVLIENKTIKFFSVNMTICPSN